MGRHYVPKLYLRGFSNEDERLWTYDRSEKHSFWAHIDNVAQGTKFYSEELERIFCDEIEAPAASALRSLREHQTLDSNGREIIARYLAAQLKRVPAGKSRYHEAFSPVAQEIRESVSHQIDALVAEDPDLANLGESRKLEVDEVIDRYIQEPPDEIWYDVIGPAYLDRISDVIRTMKWRFFFASKGSQFLTSDNPIFFFGALGLGGNDSELSFPVSRRLAMCADRRPGPDMEFFAASSQLVKEINRRTVSVSTRFVFAYSNESWVTPFAFKEHTRLKSIR